jgi:hypothetical protein
MGELSVLSHLGIKNIIWNPDNPDEVADAQNQFADFLEKGYSAFNLNSSGGEGKKIFSFDSFCQKIIMIPKVGGG